MRRKFNRKTFFGLSAGAIIGLPFLLKGLKLDAQSHAKAEGLNEEVHDWKMVTTWPPKFPVLGVGAEMLADLLQEMSGGRIRIKVFGAGELVPALGCFDAVSTGAAEMGSGVSYYWAGKAPALQFFSTVPFGLNAQQMTSWLLSGGGLDLWRREYAKFNLVPFLGGNTGVQMGGWFNREIRSIKDLQGLKMRMPGLGGKVLQKAGATAVLLSGGEIYTGLERGIIDATEWIGPYHDYKMGFHEIAKYYYAPGWHEPGTQMEFFVNQAAYDKLSDDLKKIVEAACLYIHNWILSEFESQNAKYLRLILQESDVELRQYPPEVLDQLKRYTQEVLQELIAKDEASREVYQSYRAFQDEVGQWSEQTEKLYYQYLQ